MLHQKRILSGAIAVVAMLSSRSIVCGQPQPAPSTASAMPEPTSPAPQFRPLTEADVQDGLSQVKAAAAALQQRFATAGASAEDWKTYLSWAAFEAELQKGKPDPATLAEVLEKLGAGYEGLELRWFADLRHALGNYLFVAVPDAKLADTGKDQIKALVSAAPRARAQSDRGSAERRRLSRAVARSFPAGAKVGRRGPRPILRSELQHSHRQTRSRSRRRRAG